MIYNLSKLLKWDKVKQIYSPKTLSTNPDGQLSYIRQDVPPQPGMCGQSPHTPAGVLSAGGRATVTDFLTAVLGQKIRIQRVISNKHIFHHNDYNYYYLNE
jgi:hypothetical protein